MLQSSRKKQEFNWLRCNTAAATHASLYMYQYFTCLNRHQSLCIIGTQNSVSMGEKQVFEFRYQQMQDVDGYIQIEE